MADLNTGGRWCPTCSAEYRPGFVECSDCGVLLVDERPLPPAQAGDAADHDQVEYDLEEWSAAQRAGLELLLVGQGVPHAWESSRLVVPRARDVEVDELIDAIEARPPLDDEPPSDADPGGEGETQTQGLRIARPARRLLGYFIDGTILSPLSFILLNRGSTTGHRGTSFGLRLVLAAVDAIYFIVPVALTGRTLGKVAVGTCVVDAVEGSIPGWRRATVRWGVTAAVGVLGAFVGRSGSVASLLSVLGLVYGVVVYQGLLSDPSVQGLHDKAAGTVVVETRGR